MKSLIQFKPIFLLSLTLVFVQYFTKYLDLPGRNTLTFINLPFVVAYIVMALKEIYTSNRVNMIEKIMWTIGFIGLNWLVGLIYLLFARKRILRKFKILFNETESFA
jgi:hypothetical protein